jgi:hypothetical protein
MAAFELELPHPTMAEYSAPTEKTLRAVME